MALSWFFIATCARSSRSPPNRSKYARAIRAYAPGKVTPARISYRSSAAVESPSVTSAVERLVIRSQPPASTTSFSPERIDRTASLIATPADAHASS
jgi:hypothetical protein